MDKNKFGIWGNKSYLNNNFKKIEFLIKIKYISVSKKHAIAINIDNQVYFWGTSLLGENGKSTCKISNIPYLIKSWDFKNFNKIICYNNSTIIQSSDKIIIYGKFSKYKKTLKSSVKSIKSIINFNNTKNIEIISEGIAILTKDYKLFLYYNEAHIIKLDLKMNITDILSINNEFLVGILNQNEIRIWKIPLEYTKNLNFETINFLKVYKIQSSSVIKVKNKLKNGLHLFQDNKDFNKITVSNYFLKKDIKLINKLINVKVKFKTWNNKVKIKKDFTKNNFINLNINSKNNLLKKKNTKKNFYKSLTKFQDLSNSFKKSHLITNNQIKMEINKTVNNINNTSKINKKPKKIKILKKNFLVQNPVFNNPNRDLVQNTKNLKNVKKSKKSKNYNFLKTKINESSVNLSYSSSDCYINNITNSIENQGSKKSLSLIKIDDFEKFIKFEKYIRDLKDRLIMFGFQKLRYFI